MTLYLRFPMLLICLTLCALPGRADGILVPVAPEFSPPILSADPLPSAVYSAEDVAIEGEFSAWGTSCDMQLRAEPEPGGMFYVSLQAPCARSRVFDLAWSGLRVSYQTSVTGAFTAHLPALETHSDVQVFIDNTPVLHTSVEVSDVPEYLRAGINWQNDTPFALHALEFGADFMAAGHVHAGNPVSHRGGRLFMLGDGAVMNGQRAAIYSIHKDQDTSGAVRLLIETSVSSENCDQARGADILQRTTPDAPISQPLLVPAPGCNSGETSVWLRHVLHDFNLTGK
ncbi:hypothetical protein [Halocynthiibacter sp.]|uniref:hypothetical protein n=1 Tax=Halocynthiibacter sp. TaxID=1979210 RepID=UPI003C65E68B